MILDYKTILIFAIIMCLVSCITTTVSVSVKSAKEKKFNPSNLILPLISAASIIGFAVLMFLNTGKAIPTSI